MNSILHAKKGNTDLITTEDAAYNNHKQAEVSPKSIPKIVPLYNGHELNINEQLIMNGLSTISVRNMRSKGLAIEKRNSFFNLHRPELKGLNIASAENQQGEMLQQRIIKEVKTIHETKSMKSFHNIDSEQNEQINRAATTKDHVKAESAATEETNDSNRLISLIAATIRDQWGKYFRSPGLIDADQIEEPTLNADKSHGGDVELKSTFID